MSKGDTKKVKHEPVRLISLGVFLKIDFDAADASSEKASEQEMFTACNLRHAIDLHGLCCFTGYVSVM